MENKINLNRVLLGGLVAGIVMDFVGAIVHMAILKSYYLYFRGMGSVLNQPRLMAVQILLTVLSGIPVAFLYAFARKQIGPGPKCAVIVGCLVGLMSAPYAMAEYSYYNMGRMIPAMTFVDYFVAAIAGAFIAGMIYKDKAAA